MSRGLLVAATTRLDFVDVVTPRAWRVFGRNAGPNKSHAEHFSTNLFTNFSVANNKSIYTNYYSLN